MTRKDYEKLAAAFREARPFKDEGWLYYNRCLIAVTDALAKDNPRFKKDRFFKAAGAYVLMAEEEAKK